jgi:hypothetical protein
MTIRLRRPGTVPLVVSLSRFQDLRPSLRLAMEDRATELERIYVRASASRPLQDLGADAAGPGAVSRPIDLSSGLSGDFVGDLGAALGWVPGVSPPNGARSGGASALGMDSRDNAFSLNGQPTFGGSLPRDGLTHTVRLSTYDPRLGRFAGASVTSMLQSGNFIQRSATRLTLQPRLPGFGNGSGSILPPLPWSRVFSNTMSGPLLAERTFYSISAQVQEAVTTVPTLFAQRGAADASAEFGDSLARLRQLAESLGIIRPEAFAASVIQRQRRGSAIARVDLTPNAQPSGNPQAAVLYLLMTGSADQSTNDGVGRTSTADAASRRDRTDLSLQTVWAPYLRSTLLEVRSRFALGRAGNSPASLRPSVAVVPLAAGGGTTLEALLGGTEDPVLRDRYRAWESTIDIAWRTVSGAHTYRAFAEAALHRRSIASAPSPGGQYVFAGLDALRSGNPALYARDRTDLRFSGQSSHLALALSDSWSPGAQARSPFATRPGGLSAIFGLRAELDAVWTPADEFPGRSATAASKAQYRGVQLAVLPMIGLTWRAREISRRIEGFSSSFFRHEFQGGVRQYRGGMSVLGISSLPVTAGLGQFREREECVGNAILLPSWEDSMQGEMRCRAPTGAPTVLTAPSRTTLARAWRPPQSVRAEFRWLRRQSAALSTDATITGAINTAQAGALDVNVSSLTRWRDSSEGGRPQFFGVDAVDPATGAVSPAAARNEVQRGRLIELRSDGTSRLTQLTVGATWRPRATGTPRLDPISTFSGQLRVAYTRIAGRIFGNAYTLGTTASPADRVSGRLATPAHTVLVSGRLTLDTWFTMQIGVRLSSGSRFSPVYRTDVNGDGAANDRVYVPSREAGAAQLAGLPRGIRGCLERFAGHFVAVNGCSGPWTTTMSPVLIDLDSRRFRLGSRGSLTVAVVNPLTAVDRIVNRNRPRGWGSFSALDPAVFGVVGFDTASRTFRYAPNPGLGWGRTSAALTQPPFGLTVDYRLDLSRNLETQRIETFVRRGDAGTPVPPSQFRASLLKDAEAFAAEDIGSILKSLDSLGCDSAQVLELQALGQQRTRERVALIAALAERLTNSLHDLRSKALRQAWHETMIASLESSERITARALQILRPAQIDWLLRNELLPSFTRPRGWLERERRSPQLIVR